MPATLQFQREGNIPIHLLPGCACLAVRLRSSPAFLLVRAALSLQGVCEMVPVQSLPHSSALATRCVRVCGLSSKLQKTGFCPPELLSRGHCSALGCSVAPGVCPSQSTTSTASKRSCAASSDFFLGPGISVHALGASFQLRVSFLLPWAFPSLGFLVKKNR